MALYTTTEIAAEITALKTKIAKAEGAVSYTTGLNMGVSRDLKSMYARLARLEELYDKAEALEGSSGTGGGFINKARFERPQ